MKHNLKNFPATIKLRDNETIDLAKNLPITRNRNEMVEWFMGFEKELRETIANKEIERSIAVENGNSTLPILLDLTIQRLKEILGEDSS